MIVDTEVQFQKENAAAEKSQHQHVHTGKSFFRGCFATLRKALEEQVFRSDDQEKHDVLGLASGDEKRVLVKE